MHNKSDLTNRDIHQNNLIVEEPESSDISLKQIKIIKNPMQKMAERYAPGSIKRLRKATIEH